MLIFNVSQDGSRDRVGEALPQENGSLVKDVSFEPKVSNDEKDISTFGLIALAKNVYKGLLKLMRIFT
jgi:hypothetical protein